MTTYPITDETVRLVRERADAGEPLNALADEYGINAQTISAWVLGQRRRDAGGPIRPDPLSQPKTKITPRIAEAMRAWHAEGAAVGEIARRAGVTKGTASKVVTGKAHNQWLAAKTGRPPGEPRTPAASRLRAMMAAHGITTAAQLAERGGVNIRTVQGWLSGRASPAPVTLDGIEARLKGS